MEQIKILAARRAYEFGPDDLRLSLLTTNIIRQKVTATFGFDVSQVATPMETFGPVARTLPPGVVFNWGFARLAEGGIGPIRFLHFEPQRMVFDVAGPSGVIDQAHGQLRSLLEEDRTPDGYPALGEPMAVHDWSEVSVRLQFPPSALLPIALGPIYQRALSSIQRGQEFGVVPHIGAQAVGEGRPYPGQPTGAHTYRAFSLAPRKDTSVDEGVYFSAAPLTTDAHLVYLEELEAALTT